MRLGIIAFVILAGCASEHPAVVATPYVSSEYGIDIAPAAYGNPSPYGYLPTAATYGPNAGYLGQNRFSPRQGLICERSRNICYDRHGVDYAETEKYLGSRADWYRKKRYGGPEVHVSDPQYGVGAITMPPPS